MTDPKGHTAVMAMKKPSKLSDGTAWEKLELFPTPPWATRALFEIAAPRAIECVGAKRGRALAVLPDVVWEPCAGLGHMTQPACEYASVFASDVHIYQLAPLPTEFDPRDSASRVAPLTSAAFGIIRADFFDDATRWPFERRGWIVANPPFVPAAAMLAKALELEGVAGVALLLRLQWLTGQARWREIYARTPPTVVAPFVERVPMVLGGYDPAASTATDYAWFIWMRTAEAGGLAQSDRRIADGFPCQHIEPCQVRLTKREDLALALRSVPGFVPPSALKKISPRQLAFA